LHSFYMTTHLVVTLLLLSFPIYALLYLNIFLIFLLVFYFFISSLTDSRSFKHKFQSALSCFGHLNNICLTSSLPRHGIELPLTLSC
jgi:hypothetical protein